VVDVPHFCQHAIQVQGVDHTPSESAQPGVVQQDGRQFARELEDKTQYKLILKSFDLYDCDLFRAQKISYLALHHKSASLERHHKHYFSQKHADD